MYLSGRAVYTLLLLLEECVFVGATALVLYLFGIKKFSFKRRGINTSYTNPGDDFIMTLKWLASERGGKSGVRLTRILQATLDWPSATFYKPSTALPSSPSEEPMTVSACSNSAPEATAMPTKWTLQVGQNTTSTAANRSCDNCGNTLWVASCLIATKNLDICTCNAFWWMGALVSILPASTMPLTNLFQHHQQKEKGGSDCSPSDCHRIQQPEFHVCSGIGRKLPPSSNTFSFTRLKRKNKNQINQSFFFVSIEYP